MKMFLTVSFGDPAIPEKWYECTNVREVVKIIQYWMRTVDDRVRYCVHKSADEQLAKRRM